jgi:hypothetical protein
MQCSAGPASCAPDANGEPNILASFPHQALDEEGSKSIARNLDGMLG